jgi:cob(I)alamin adenosyltransferase
MAFKIYTKTGDQGETGLFGGRRVPKSHLRVDAYGALDELNSFVGWLRDSVSDEKTRSVLAGAQHRLFDLGAHMAADPDKQLHTPDLRPADAELLEAEMDRMETALPPLKNFILPGGHPTVSLCHVCRTVCRRAERSAVALHLQSPLNPLALLYLNRLSDYFFVLARQLSQELGAPEMPWEKRTD